MNCQRIKKLLNLYIDEGLDAETARQVKEHLKSCPACHQEYENLKDLVNALDSFATSPQVAPADFTANLMAKISQSSPRKAESIFSFRVLGVAVAAVVVVFFTFTFIFNQPDTSSMCYAEVQFSLRLADQQAHTVAIAGDFNGWNPQSNLLEDVEGDGIWTGTLKLEPGRYEYMFVIDGEKWLPDPNAFRYVKDGFGNKNAILEINNCQKS